MKALILVLVAMLVTACSGAGASASTSQAPDAPRSTTQTTQEPAQEDLDPVACTLEMRTYSDLASCEGPSEEYSIKLAKDFDGKTVARIIVPAKDPLEILAAMGSYTREWSVGADSFTVFAIGSETDAAEGGYNRGRIFWNNGGPIDVQVCKAYVTIESLETCDDFIQLTLTN